MQDKKFTRKSFRQPQIERAIKQSASLIFDERSLMGEATYEVAKYTFMNFGSLDDGQDESILQSMMQIDFFIRSCPFDLSIEEFTMTCIKNLKYEFFSQGSPVFHIGEKGDRFYIILSGQVRVYLQNDEQMIEEATQQRKIRFLSKQKRGNFDPLIFEQQQISMLKKKFS